MAGHPTKDELSGFILGTLSPELIDGIADHIEHCSPCHDTVCELDVHKDTLLDGLRKPPAAEEAGCHKAVDKAVAVAIESQSNQAAAHQVSLSAPSLPAAAAPAATGPSREQFLHVLSASGLLDADEFNRLQGQFPAVAQADTAAAQAQALVACGALTKFQAALVYQNKAKGLTFGEYVVLDRLGAGGMGQVLKAKHRRMDRVVALKILSKAALNSPDAVKRFQREVKAAAKLTHPNIVIAHDAGQQDGVHYLVMEYVPGSDLSALVKRDGPLSVAKATNYTLQVARGLAFAHSKGVVHRDIKPANLLLDDEGTVKILDMGLARLDGDNASQAAGEGLTQTGQVMGTVDYMAPEQAFDTSTADAKADMYSLGCSFYRMLTGQNMFTGDTLVQKILAHREQSIPSLRAARPEVPETLDAIYQRMVAKQPQDRPSMAQLVTELEALEQGEPTRSFTLDPIVIDHNAAGRRPVADSAITAKPNAAGNRGKKPFVKWIAAAAAGFVFIALGVWVIIRDKDNNEIGRMQVPEGGSALVTDVRQSSVGTGHRSVEYPNVKSNSTTNASLVATPDPHNSRAFAELIISRGGKVTPAGRKGIDGRPLEIGQVSELPSGDWTIEAISLRSNSLATDDFMSRLAQVPSLRRLYLHDANLTASGVRHLCAITTLEELWLTHVPVGDEIMKDVVRLTALKRLVIAITNITDASLIQLKQMPSLTSVDVSGTTVTDNGLRELANLQQLTYLNFRGTSISDVGLEHLTSLKKLKTLILEKTRVTSQGLESIRRALPSLEIDLGRSSTAPQVVITPFDPAQAIDLLPLLQPATHLFGKWEFVGGAMQATITDKSHYDRLAFDYPAPDEYDLRVQVERLELGKQGTGILLGLVSGNSRFAVGVDHGSMRNCALSIVDDGKSTVQSTKVGPQLEMGKKHDLLVKVRRTGVQLYLDDKQQFSFEGALNRLSRDPAVDAKFPRFFLTSYVDVRFHRLQLVPMNVNVPAAPAPAVVPFDSAQARVHQEAWAKHLGTSVETTNSVGQTMILIPPGAFLMGSTDEQVEAALKAADSIGADQSTKDRIEKTERPQHQVAFTQPMRMSATEVTVGQFKQFSAATKYVTEAENVAQGDPTVQTYLNPGYATTDDSPAAMITWNDAAAYCEWLTQQETRPERPRKYRLPTEAEWEYACRAGTTTQYSFGDDYHELSKYGWYYKNAGDRSHWVGSLLPNPFGLFDMHGNLWEWCSDYWDESWYEKTLSQNIVANDPIGPSAGSVPLRVMRGGNWLSNASFCRSAYRNLSAPSSRNYYHGFRCVSDVETPAVAVTSAVQSIATPSTKPTPVAPPIAQAPFDAGQARAHQEAWAKYLGVPVEYTNSIGMKFMLIPPGDFLMGSTDEQVTQALASAIAAGMSESDLSRIRNAERLQHRVRLTQPWYLGIVETTAGQFRKFVESELYVTETEKLGGGGLSAPGAKGDPQKIWRTPGRAFPVTDQQDAPVTQVTWNDAVAFCQWLSMKEASLAPGDRLAAAYNTGHLADADQPSRIPSENASTSRSPRTKYRLPTEAEWEFACRAGTTTSYWFGDNESLLDQFDWVKSNSLEKLSANKPKPANPFGLVHLHGNVMEWCGDRYESAYYQKSPINDPPGPMNSPNRVIRGGDWNALAPKCRSAFRFNHPETVRNNTLGFRVVREILLP